MNQTFEKTNSPLVKNETNDTLSNGISLGMFAGKNLLIVILTVLLIFSFLGINLLVDLGNFTINN